MRQVEMKPESELSVRQRYWKPWVSYGIRPRRPGGAWLVLAPRGLRHDPERTAAKRRRNRSRQGKDRR